MDIPRRGIEECEVGDLDFIRVHDLDEVRSGVVQLPIVELVPPHSTLTIDRAIVTCKKIDRSPSNTMLQVLTMA